jgi:hypothetical protein
VLPFAPRNVARPAASISHMLRQSIGIEESYTFGMRSGELERLRQKRVNSSSVISPEPIANSRCFMAPLPQTGPSILTL